jgi:hypothetical protein
MKNKINLAELGLIATFGLTGISGFVMSQSKQPYSLTQLKFCPKSANNDIKSQRKLNKEFCKTSRFVLTEEWDKYGKFGGQLPDKGEAIQAVSTIDTDNPNQMAGGLFAVVGLWGATLTTYFRLQRIKENDYILNEKEKTHGYGFWEESKQERDVKRHAVSLKRDRIKDGLSALDVEQRVDLGLTDPENEAAKNQLQVEDLLKNRFVGHSEADKKIAENLLAKAKADTERQKLEKQVADSHKSSNEQINQDAKSVRDKLVSEMIEALKAHEGGWMWKLIDNITPLWIIGKAGSGKTWTASTIALIRQHCLDSEIYLLMDRHATGDNAKVWSYLNPKFVAEELPQIKGAMAKCMEHWELRIKHLDDYEKPIAKMKLEQVIIDEYTNLKDLKEIMQDTPDLWYKMQLTDPRKALSQVLGITHGDTNGCYPDNTKDSRDAGTILLRKFSANGRAPLPRVKVERGLVDDQGNELVNFEGTIPDWFNPATVYGYFNGDNKINF